MPHQSHAPQAVSAWSRNAARKEVVRLQIMLDEKCMTEKNREDIQTKLANLSSELDTCKPVLDEESFLDRKQTIQENGGLREIFTSLWWGLSKYVDDSNSSLTMVGYVKFHLVLSKALGAVFDVSHSSAAIEAAERDYDHDMTVYGIITREIFFDIVFQVIDLYTEFIDPMYYESFAWAILACIVDMKVNPPRLKPLRSISCIMRKDNEASMISDFWVQRRLLQSSLS